ncbi:hypothetical protein CesoFtcFv8_002766 [Champsocephalus esox]|uniref:Uncharacterized protein n=1 Tax=Champsocephalus esox TaxID=159716 RepID=A0AAN8HEY4_9TELE|nr:hypothetical protein CesoFtcFv8_002766 [Champsocephalus esox]
MPDKNASLRTQCPIPRLKSHLHLTALSFPSSIFPSVRPSYLSAPLLPARCSCDEGPQTPSLSSSSSPSRFCCRPDHTCHLHRTQGPRDLRRYGAFIHPSPRPSEPLIPSSRPPVTEEWPVQRAEWDTGAAVVVRKCVSSRARGNQRR